MIDGLLGENARESTSVGYAPCGCPDWNDTYRGACWGRCSTIARRRREQALNFWIRVLRIVAIGLGVWGALYLLGGDRDPAAAQGERPRTPIEYVSAITVYHQPGFDFAGTQFFEVRFRAGGAALISVDGDLELASWLRNHVRDNVQLVLRVQNPLTREGEGQ